MDWKIDAVLSLTKSTWGSTIILTGDTNIDLLSSSMTRDMYKQMLHRYQLSSHITKPTREGKKLMDHISSNIWKSKILHLDILPCLTISDHEALHVIVNIPTKMCELRSKFMKKLKHFGLGT